MGDIILNNISSKTTRKWFTGGYDEEWVTGSLHSVPSWASLPAPPHAKVQTRARSMSLPTPCISPFGPFQEEQPTASSLSANLIAVVPTPSPPYPAVIGPPTPVRVGRTYFFTNWFPLNRAHMGIRYGTAPGIHAVPLFAPNSDPQIYYRKYRRDNETRLRRWTRSNRSRLCVGIPILLLLLALVIIGAKLAADEINGASLEEDAIGSPVDISVAGG